MIVTIRDAEIEIEALKRANIQLTREINSINMKVADILKQLQSSVAVLRTDVKDLKEKEK